MKNSQHPPGPAAYQQFALLQKLRKDILGTLRHLAQTYGDIVYFTIGPVKFFFVNHPDYVKELLVTQPHNFVKTRGMRMTKRFLGEGLLTSEGELHQRHRRILQPALHHSSVSRYVDTILDCVQARSTSWNERSTIDCFDEMMRMTFSIMSRILFTRTDEDELETIRRGMEAGRTIFSRGLNPIGALLDSLPLPGTFKLHNAKRHFDKVVYNIIQRNISETSSNADVLSLLLSSDLNSRSRKSETRFSRFSFQGMRRQHWD